MIVELIKELKNTRRIIRDMAIDLIKNGNTNDDKELRKLFDLQDILSKKIKELQE